MLLLSLETLSLSPGHVVLLDQLLAILLSSSKRIAITSKCSKAMAEVLYREFAGKQQ